MCENHFMFLADMHTKTEGFVRKHVMRVEIAVVRFQTLCELAGRQGLSHEFFLRPSSSVDSLLNKHPLLVYRIAAHSLSRQARRTSAILRRSPCARVPRRRRF